MVFCIIINGSADFKNKIKVQFILVTLRTNTNLLLQQMKLMREIQSITKEVKQEKKRNSGKLGN